MAGGGTPGAGAMRVVALEEHVWTAELRDALIAVDDEAVRLARRFPAVDERLREIGEGRLARMDRAGVDVQVLSVTTPGTQSLAPAQAVALARQANDVMAAAVRRHPGRFTAFATLPTPDPEAAAEELRRCVTELGMVGAMLFPRTGERPLDHPSLRPVFEAAAQLRVPLYLHPQFPPKAIRELAYSGFDPVVDELLASGGWGWHAEAGLSALRLVLAGTFDRHPELQLILGHWGEMLVAFLDRADVLTGAARYLQRSVGEVVRDNMHVTAGGIYSPRMLQTVLAALGPERVMMATDDPYQQRYADGEARTFLAAAGLGVEDQARIAHVNAERLGLAPPRAADGTELSAARSAG
jgi:predicted TIM-barrel fold metal-dependent hydrolase